LRFRAIQPLLMDEVDAWMLRLRRKRRFASDCVVGREDSNLHRYERNSALSVIFMHRY
jgi:hypothetical protein